MARMRTTKKFKRTGNSGFRRKYNQTRSVPRGAKASKRPVNPYVRSSGQKKEQKYFVTCTSAELMGNEGDTRLKAQGYVQALLVNDNTTEGRGKGIPGSAFPKYIYQGVARNQRMGDQIFMKSLTLKLAMYFHESAESGYGGNAEYRIAVVLDTQPSASGTLSHSDLPKVYDFVDSHLNFSPNPLYARRFVILKDELIAPKQKLSYHSEGVFNFETQLIRKEYHIPINRPFFFGADSTPASLVNNNIYLVLFSSITPTGHGKERTVVHLDYQGTFLFEDA